MAEKYWMWIDQLVPYFSTVKYNIPFKIKIERGIPEVITQKTVDLIDQTIFNVKEDKESTKDTRSAKEKRVDVPQPLFDAWNKIRKEPEKYSLWCTFFKKRWRTLDGIRGKWVYLYHFFSLEEMTKEYGRRRRRILQGILLNKPISVVTPPTKNQWVDHCIERDRRKGLHITRNDIKKYEREYRRISKENWLNVFFYPTVTTTGEAEVLDRLEGFERVVAIFAHAQSDFRVKLANAEVYEHFVSNAQNVITQLRLKIHEVSDKLGSRTQLVQELNRIIAELETPSHISPEHAPLPITPFPQPIMEEKPSKLKALSAELSWSLALIFLGIGMFFVGFVMYALNPAYVAVMAFSAMFFLFGVFLRWREKRGKPLPTALKPLEETSEALRERLMEES